MVYHRAARAAVKRTTALAPVVLILLFSSTPSAQPPLTLEEAQRRAVERSRGLAAQDFATTASREMAVAAGQLPDPIVTLGVNNLPIDTSDRFSLTRDFMPSIVRSKVPSSAGEVETTNSCLPIESVIGPEP